MSSLPVNVHRSSIPHSQRLQAACGHFTSLRDFARGLSFIHRLPADLQHDFAWEVSQLARMLDVCYWRVRDKLLGNITVMMGDPTVVSTSTCDRTADSVAREINDHLLEVERVIYLMNHNLPKTTDEMEEHWQELCTLMRLVIDSVAAHCEEGIQSLKQLCQLQAVH